MLMADIECLARSSKRQATFSPSPYNPCIPSPQICSQGFPPKMCCTSRMVLFEITHSFSFFTSDTVGKLHITLKHVAAANLCLIPTSSDDI